MAVRPSKEIFILLLSCTPPHCHTHYQLISTRYFLLNSEPKQPSCWPPACLKITNSQLAAMAANWLFVIFKVCCKYVSLHAYSETYLPIAASLLRCELFIFFFWLTPCHTSHSFVIAPPYYCTGLMGADRAPLGSEGWYTKASHIVFLWGLHCGKVSW